MIILNSLSQGVLKWYSRLYRNQGSLLFGPGPLDWGEQIVVVTGGTYSAQHQNNEIANLFFLPGASGIGELLANTLAVRNVNVIVLDINPIMTENCAYTRCFHLFPKLILIFQTTSLIINATSQNGKK